MKKSLSAGSLTSSTPMWMHNKPRSIHPVTAANRSGKPKAAGEGGGQGAKGLRRVLKRGHPLPGGPPLTHEVMPRTTVVALGSQSRPLRQSAAILGTSFSSNIPDSTVPGTDPEGIYFCLGLTASQARPRGETTTAQESQETPANSNRPARARRSPGTGGAPPASGHRATAVQLNTVRISCLGSSNARTLVRRVSHSLTTHESQDSGITNTCHCRSIPHYTSPKSTLSRVTDQMYCISTVCIEYNTSTA